MRGTMIPPVLVVDVQVPKMYQAVHFFALWVFNGVTFEIALPCKMPQTSMNKISAKYTKLSIFGAWG
jgi:hypothetical protein